MIPTKTITEILQTAKITEVISEHVQLRRRGVNWIGLCPFHQEKTPSFSVSPAKNIFKCFGCGQAGNAVKFLMEHQQLSFPEAIRSLAKKYGITIEERPLSPEQQQKIQAEESLFLLNQTAQAYFQNNRSATDENGNIQKNYFKSRGYHQTTIEKWGLGLANSQKSFTKYATQNAYRLEQLQQIGLTTKTGHDFFRNRAIFPIHNLWGKVAGFAGRILSEHNQTPKYLNSLESEIYQKSQLLFGAYFAKKAMRQQDECLLAEGYTDVISLHQAGIENVVASAGTSLTAEQIRIIKRFTKNITLLYDGDTAGFRAATRGADLILQQDMNVKIVVFPKGEDPDSYLQRLGIEGFKTFLQQATRDFILLKTHFLIRDAAGNPSQKTASIKDLLNTINQIPDAIKQTLYLQECAKLLGIQQSILTQQIRQINGKKLTVVQKPATYLSAKNTNYLPEKQLIRCLLKFGSINIDAPNSTTIADYIFTNLEDVLPMFEYQPFQLIAEKYQEITVSSPDFSIQNLLDNLPTDLYDIVIDLLNTDGILPPQINHIEYAKKTIQKIKLRKINDLIAQNQIRINEEADDTQLHKFLKTHQKLLKMKQAVARELGLSILN